jgi:hypothetical protein
VFNLISTNRLPSRKASGSQLAEFAPALMVLVGVVFLPLLDLTIIPIRWMLAQNLINDYSRQLALCETFGQSQEKMSAEPSLATRLQSLGGISTRSMDLRLKVSRLAKGGAADQSYIARLPGEIPREWLPNGSNAPCSYTLELQIDSLMSPAILLPTWGLSPVPGLTAPIPLLITASHEWENLGRDPRNKEFFFNE